MKVLVLFCGEISSVDKARSSIYNLKDSLDYDFKCVTWNRNINHDFVDMYFDEPRWTYWPPNNKNMIKRYIDILRNRKELTRDHVFTTIHEKQPWSFDRIKRRHMQIIQYALALKEFGNDYDIIIKNRYDHFWQSNEYTEIVKLCTDNNVVQMLDKNYNPNDAEERLSITDKISSDFTFAHRRELFDANYVLSLHKNKELCGGERGWSQA